MFEIDQSHLERYFENSYCALIRKFHDVFLFQDIYPAFLTYQSGAGIRHCKQFSEFNLHQDQPVAGSLHNKYPLMSKTRLQREGRK